jgi:hypothetical protein
MSVTGLKPLTGYTASTNHPGFGFNLFLVIVICLYQPQTSPKEVLSKKILRTGQTDTINDIKQTGD